MSAVKIQNSLDNLIKFISPFHELINCHMVSYLTDNHWGALIPNAIQQEINTITVEHKEFLNYLWSGSYLNPSYPELNQFLAKLQAQRDEHFNSNCLQLDELVQLEILNFPINNDLLQIKEFMSDKKCHEVEVTSSVIANLCKKYDNKLFVVDAGDGKGYLSSRLALEHDLKVLGIDANRQNTESAQKRISKLSKAWNGLTKRAEEINNGIVPPKRGRRKKTSSEVVPATNRGNYRTSTEFITSKTDFHALIKNNFPDVNPEKCILSGLHTCGNLAADCLKIFVENRDIEIVVNIGCCYHLLNEQFTVDKFYNDRIRDNQKSWHNDTGNVGFPLSTYLKNKSYYLGRNARMLGLQSIFRVNSTKELPNKTLFYRALLEVLIVEQNPDLANIIQVGKIKCENFQEYVEKCSLKNNLNLDCSRAKLDALENKYEMCKFLLNCFYLLRMQFSSVLESIILLDRILYLHENSIEHVFLTRLFDPVISPRCYGIIGIKSK